MKNIDEIYADCMVYKFDERIIRVILEKHGYTEQEINEYLEGKESRK